MLNQDKWSVAHLTFAILDPALVGRPEITWGGCSFSISKVWQVIGREKPLELWILFQEIFQCSVGHLMFFNLIGFRI